LQKNNSNQDALQPMMEDINKLERHEPGFALLCNDAIVRHKGFP
jgi:hypothetical protein